MMNPWLETEPQTFGDNKIIVASDDWKYFDKLLRTSEKLKHLHLDIYPQHFVGDLKNAEIIILSLNPGYKPEYKDAYKKEKGYEDIIRNNLEMKNSRFHALDLATEDELGYWGKRLKFLVDDNNSKSKKKYILDSLKRIAQNIALAEFFPYHSESYNDWFDKIPTKVKIDTEEYLPSQKFLFTEIKKRIKKKDVIIILARAFRKWYEAIPELKDYEKCYEVTNPNNPSLKPEYIYKVERTSVKTEMEEIIREIKNRS